MSDSAPALTYTSQSDARLMLARVYAALRVSIGASRAVITIPIYVLLSAVALIPIGFTVFLVLPFHPQLSVFDGFLGDLLSYPNGAPQSGFTYFYIYLYLMSYLSIASVIGYEERRDRSIVFWKSLPIGDGMWILGQIMALFIALVIGIVCLLAIVTVVTIWEYAYLVGLNSVNAHFFSSLFDTYANTLRIVGNALLIVYLSLPFGVSMLWFATFCKRQPGTFWLGTFVSAYLLLFILRYIGIEIIEPLLWYPDSFFLTASWLLLYDRLPVIQGGVGLMVIYSFVGTIGFGYLTYRFRRRAMPVA